MRTRDVNNVSDSGRFYGTVVAHTNGLLFQSPGVYCDLPESRVADNRLKCNPSLLPTPFLDNFGLLTIRPQS
jgi:hypothetical protein